MNSYEFSRFYSDKVIKIVHNLVAGKKYKNCRTKNGYKFNMKSYGFRINFYINFVNGTLKNGCLYLHDKWLATCTQTNITIPIFNNDKIYVDVKYIQSILIHEFTHCFQAIKGMKPFEQSEEDYELWLMDEDEQEAIMNQFQFELDCGKAFDEIIKIGNFKNLYNGYPHLFDKFERK